jgi:hypothetical protein
MGPMNASQEVNSSPEALLTRQRELAFDGYSNALQMALVDFQYIEECLRLYIASSYDYIRYKVADKLPFKLDGTDLDKDPLARLIDKYSKLSNNEELVAEVRKLLPKRNEIAHRGLMLNAEQQKDVKFLDEQTKRLWALHGRLKRHIQTLLDERAALTGEPNALI